MDTKSHKKEYIDTFIFPIEKKHLMEYKTMAEKVAQIWRENGAISYTEVIEEDLEFEGVKSFQELIKNNSSEILIMGWVVFPSKNVRIAAHKKVPNDIRMQEITKKLFQTDIPIFDPKKMYFGGFTSFITT